MTNTDFVNKNDKPSIHPAVREKIVYDVMLDSNIQKVYSSIKKKTFSPDAVFLAFFSMVTNESPNFVNYVSRKMDKYPSLLLGSSNKQVVSDLVNFVIDDLENGLFDASIVKYDLVDRGLSKLNPYFSSAIKYYFGFDSPDSSCRKISDVRKYVTPLTNTHAAVIQDFIDKGIKSFSRTSEGIFIKQNNCLLTSNDVSQYLSDKCYKSSFDGE